MSVKQRIRSVARGARVGTVLPLDLTVRLYGDTDKSQHDYTRWYVQHLRSRRFKRNRLLEIGVGGYEHVDRGGGSLRVWRDHLPRTEVVGFDINEKRIDLGRRVQIVRGDQTSPEDLDRAIVALGGPPDIVIDDGSHLPDHAWASFQHLFPKMPSGSIYVVEDLVTSFIPSWGGAPDAPPNTAVGMARSLVDAVQANDPAFGFRADWTAPDPSMAEVAAISVYPGVFFVEKR